MVNQSVTKSDQFRISRWRCYLLMLIHDAAWLGWSLLVVVAALIILGFVFSPWIGLAAIGVSAFLVVMALSFVIMAYGFNSITGVNMAKHSLRSEPGSIVIEFEDGHRMEVAKSDIRPYNIYPGGVTAPVDGARPGWLWIPPKAFENDEEFKDFLKSIYRDESNTE